MERAGSRVEELRSRHRRIVGWSLVVAALAHVAVLFVWTPEFHVGRPEMARIHWDSVDRSEGPRAYVTVVFGPPEVLLRDGGVRREPSTRVLEARRAIRLPIQCGTTGFGGSTPISGRVRLQVEDGGMAGSAELAEGTGDPCGDRVILRLAESLLYHWLPDDHTPAPVELIQPVAIEEVRY